MIHEPVAALCKLTRDYVRVSHQLSCGPAAAALLHVVVQCSAEHRNRRRRLHQFPLRKEAARQRDVVRINAGNQFVAASLNAKVERRRDAYIGR